jgi:macrolide transport system ATP-binding/permease protein
VLDRLRQDLRFAWRQLVRAPAFALTAIATLALGIGANTGIFSIINGFMRPMPVPAADRIVVLAADTPDDDTGLRFEFSYPELVDYREQADVFSDVFAYVTRLGGLTVDGQTRQFLYHAVTGDFFTGLGLTPAAGRLFTPGEGEHLGAERVVVLGHAYWQRRFGGREDVVGTMLRLDGQPARVVGVAPAGFHGLHNATTMDGYVPLANMQARTGQTDWLFADRASSYLTMIGRLRPHVTVREAQAAVDIVAQRLASLHPTTKGIGVRVIPEPEARPVPLKFFATILPVIRALLFLLATLVLLLACLNVTNLLFVRATARAREMAVRTALGSGQLRLIRLLLVESLMLAIAGALAGVLLGRLAGTLLVGSLNVALDIPINLDFSFDWRVFRYAFAVALFTGVVIGIVPAWRASRTRVTDVLHDGGRSGTPSARRQRVRSALVIAQVAGSLVLLIVAGFLVRSLQSAQRIDLSFDPDQLVTMRVDPFHIGYDPERTAAFYDTLETRLRDLPGVEFATTAFNTPMSYFIGSCPVQVEGASATDSRSWPAVPYTSVGTNYFDTLRLPIVRGRPFDDRDVLSTTPVVIVNETLAAQFWPGQNPIGKRLDIRCVTKHEPWEVIGVAHDSKYIAVFEQPLPYLYVSTGQTRPSLRVVIVRSAAPFDDIAGRVQREIAAIDPDIPVADIRNMRDTINGSIGYVMFRVGATQAGAMGVLGLILAVVGVYGVVSYGASQRVREIGIRLALGAQPTDVRQLVLRQGAWLVFAGVACGLVASAVVTIALTRFVVLVSATDPLTFVLVTTTLVVIALVACYLPARRAMRVDPMTALRHE